MPADIAVLGEVGDLVLLVAKGFERLDSVEIHIGLRVVVGQICTVLVLIELRTRLDLEPVAGDVVGLEVNDVAQRLHPLFAALIGKAEHQIDRHVVKARAARQRHGLLRLLVVMRPAERLELLVKVTLHADGDAVEARAPQAHEHRQRHGVGVCLKRDLSVAADVETAVDLGKEPA